METLVSRASMIRLSLQPSLSSETSDLQKPLRRALALADHRFKLLTLFRAQPHDIPLQRRRLRRHNFLHRSNHDG
jgi:hypothetical protein